MGIPFCLLVRTKRTIHMQYLTTFYLADTNFCENSSCAHMCLLSATDSRGYSCMCRNGYSLDSNGENCTCKFPLSVSYM